jgi:hypothetical protein
VDGVVSPPRAPELIRAKEGRVGEKNEGVDRGCRKVSEGRAVNEAIDLGSL